MILFIYFFLSSLLCIQIVNETIPALQKLKDAGKIRFIGITGLPLGIFTYVLDRVPPGSVDVILSYCHYSINDSTLEDLLPYLKSKGIGVITASPLAMGLLTESGPPEWHPASPELKVDLFHLSVNRLTPLTVSFPQKVVMSPLCSAKIESIKFVLLLVWLNFYVSDFLIGRILVK